MGTSPEALALPVAGRLNAPTPVDRAPAGSNPSTGKPDPGAGSGHGAGHRHGRGHGHHGRRHHGRRHHGHRNSGFFFGSHKSFGFHQTSRFYGTVGYGTSSLVSWVNHGFHYLPHQYSYSYHPYHYLGYRHGFRHYGHRWYKPYHHGSAFSFGYYGSKWRFSFGFGTYRSPYHYKVRYPRYRVYRYYPYSYYNTVAYYPAYSTCYADYTRIGYVETYDPYVDFTDEVPVAAPVEREVAEAEFAVPELFHTPLVADFPADLRREELFILGKDHLRDGEYLFAAEAFRRAWIALADDDLAPFELGFALAMDGERLGMAHLALSEGFVRHPSWADRELDLRGRLRHGAELDDAMRDIERHLILDEEDRPARFILAYLRYFEGDWFAAHRELTRLEAVGFDEEPVTAMKAAAEERLTESVDR